MTSLTHVRSFISCLHHVCVWPPYPCLSPPTYPICQCQRFQFKKINQKWFLSPQRSHSPGNMSLLDISLSLLDIPVSLLLRKAQELSALCSLCSFSPCSFWTTGISLMSPPLHMSLDIAFCFITELVHSGLCLSSRSHQSVLPNTVCFQLSAWKWVLSKDTFSPASPTDDFVSLSWLLEWSIHVEEKSSFHSVISYFVLFSHPAVLQMFLQLHIFKSSQVKRGICSSKHSTGTCADKINSLSYTIMLNLIWIAALGTCNSICPSVNKLPFWVVL